MSDDKAVEELLAKRKQVSEKRKVADRAFVAGVRTWTEEQEQELLDLDNECQSIDEELAHAGYSKLAKRGPG